MQRKTDSLRTNAALTVGLALVTVLVTTACTPTASPKPVVPKTAAAPDAPSVADDNWGFEQGLEGPWTVYGRASTWTVDRSTVAEGQRSLRFGFEDASAFGGVARPLQVEEYRGRRIRLSARFKTEKTIAGWARIWTEFEASGEPKPALVRKDVRIWGAIDWTQLEVLVSVPKNATSLDVGALVAGSGGAWLDDVTVSVVDNAFGGAARLEGRILSRDGQPVVGASVAAIRASTGEPVGRATSDKDARFVLDVPGDRVGITVTAAGHGAAYVRPDEITTERGLEIRLSEARHTISGSIRYQKTSEPIAGAELLVMRASEEEADAFVVYSDDRGNYEIAFAAPTALWNVQSRGTTYSASSGEIPAAGSNLTLNLQATGFEAAPRSVIEWLAENANPLDRIEPDGSLEDLRGFGRFVEGARIVGLGEATHGTSEFFTLKHRLIRYLVEEHGFSAVAFELSLAETDLINDYVVDGRGDPRRALAAPHFWIYNTEEVLRLAEWMRAFNQERPRADRVRFVGFDMQFSGRADRVLFRYLEQVDPTFAASARPPLLPVVDGSGTSLSGRLTEEERLAFRDGVARIRKHLESRRSDYVARSSPRTWQRMLRYLRTIEQLGEMLYLVESNGERAFRDQAMAENALWHLEQAKDDKIVLWGHNVHLTRSRITPEYPSMGHHLARALGPAYRSVGFVFHQGSFQASSPDATVGHRSYGGVRAVSAGPGQQDLLERAFARLGRKALFVDVRNSALSSAPAWLRSDRQMKSAGSLFFGESSMPRAINLTEDFDGILFVDETTRARPLYDRGWRSWRR